MGSSQRKVGKVRSTHLYFQSRKDYGDIIIIKSSTTHSENVVLKFTLKEIQTAVKIYMLKF